MKPRLARIADFLLHCESFDIMNPWLIAGMGLLGTGAVVFMGGSKPTKAPGTAPTPAPVPVKPLVKIGGIPVKEITAMNAYGALAPFPDRWTKPAVVPITDGKDKAVLLPSAPAAIGKSISAEVQTEISKVIKPSDWAVMKADVKAKAIAELNKQLGINLPPNASLNQIGDAMIAKGMRETGNAIGGALCGPPCAAVVANVGDKFGQVIGRHVNLSSLAKKTKTKVKRVVGRWF